MYLLLMGDGNREFPFVRPGENFDFVAQTVFAHFKPDLRVVVAVR